METAIPSRRWTTSLRGLLSDLWRDHAVRYSVIIFLLLRLFTGVAAFYIVSVDPVGKPSWLDYDPNNPHANQSGETYNVALPTNAPLSNIVVPWHRYDTAWYVKIAIQGYRADNAIVFPPLYPVLVRLLAPFSGWNYVLSSLIVSNIACLIAFILLYKLIQREFGDDGLATRTLICLAAFPTAYYLVAGYTETLFLALTLGGFLATLDKRWGLAALLGFLAALTRLQGAALCIPFAWIAYVECRERGLMPNLKRLPAVIAPPLGALSYLLYLSLNNLGTLDRAFANEWRLTTQPPWIAINAFIARVQQGIVLDFESNNAFILVVMVVLAIVVTFQMRPAYALYVWSSLAVILLRYHENGPQFESIFRYALLLFPCFIAAAMLLRRWWLWLPYAAGTLQWQYYLLNEFIHWHWVA